MSILPRLYKESLALLTDQYELSMAYSYWKDEVAENEAVFNLFFRKHPFSGGFTIAAGLELVCDFLQNFSFTSSDLEYLSGVTDKKGEPLFDEKFLNYLDKLQFSCDVDAMPEGTAAFPNQPLIRVKGPLLQCQLLETPLLNLTNFSTLIATKAARMKLAAGDKQILDFGLRRAQGIDGGITATRSAFIGGCSSTSNVLAGKLFGIPIKGTHAHSWIMYYEDEKRAFEKFAEAMPNNSIFLVDTYNSIDGIQNAIEVGLKMRKKGHEMNGIRLDSGDLVELSKKARKMLNDAGFEEAKIVASSEIDEFKVEEHQQKNAPIDIYGIGTKLVTGDMDPALGGVYKISGRKIRGEWQYTLKLSEEEIKINNPGIQQVRRFEKNSKHAGDMLYDAIFGAGDTMIAGTGEKSSLSFDDSYEHKDLLKPIFRQGKLVYDLPSLESIQEKVQTELQSLPGETLKLRKPGEYPYGLEEKLYHKKQELISKMQEKSKT